MADRTPRSGLLAVAWGLPVALVLGAGPASGQTTLDFDALPAGVTIPNGFGGFTWASFLTTPPAATSVFGCNPSGINCATNAFGLTAAVARPTRFSFLSGYFTAWAGFNTLNQPFTMLVRGRRGSLVMHTATITVPSARTLFTFNWTDIDRVEFSPADINWFLLDDFTYGPQFYAPPPPTVIPEPVTLVLLGSGLVGIGAVRLRRRRGREPAGL
jgi:hypothetical protein